MAARPPKLPTINLRNLEIFVIVSRLGSISRASTSLGMAQSVVSKCIAQLEQDWGEKLFDRTGRGVHMSEFGKRMLPRAEALLAQCASLQEEARSAASEPSGLVRIGIVPSLMKTIVAGLYEAVSRAAPDVRLQFVEAMQGPLENQLASGRLDLAVLNRYGSKTSVLANEEYLGESKTYLVMRPGHPLSRRTTVDFRELNGLPLVVPIAPSGLRSLLDQLARQEGITLHIAFEVESLVAMKRFVRAADALTILPFLGIEDDVRSGDLSAVEIVNPAIPRRIGLVLSREHPPSKAARFVAAELRKTVPALLVE